MATEEEALAQQRQIRAARRTRIYGEHPHVWAESRIGSTEHWNLYRLDHGVMNAKRVRIGELLTRNHKAIRSVLDALAPFAQDDCL